jgi:hypothetical protein
MRIIVPGSTMTRLASAVLVGGLALSLIPAASAAPASPASSRPISGEGVGIEPVQYRNSQYCRQLRRACVHKDARGERGKGNCARYRSECTSGYRSWRRRWD